MSKIFGKVPDTFLSLVLITPSWSRHRLHDLIAFMACNYAFGVESSVNAGGLHRCIVLFRFHVFLHLCCLFCSLPLPTLFGHLSVLLLARSSVFSCSVFRYIHPQRTCSSTNQPLYSDGTSGPSLLLFTFYWHVSPSCEVFCFLINL